MESGDIVFYLNDEEDITEAFEEIIDSHKKDLKIMLKEES